MVPLLSLLALVASAQGMVFIGRLSELSHDVSGKVSAISPKTLLISDFTYDGLGPDTFFLIGTFGTPEQNAEDGTILSYPYDGRAYDFFDQNPAIIGNSFNKEEVMLHLPDDISLDQIAWLSIWCRQVERNFGSVNFPRRLDFSSLDMPPTRGVNAVSQGDVAIGRLSELSHSVSGNVVANSLSTLLIKDFTYDGTGPDTFFLIGTFGTPEENAEDGIILSYPYDGRAYNFFDQDPAIIGRAFNKEEVMLHLPDDIGLDQIAWLSIWCRQVERNFGSLNFPRNLDLTKLDAKPSSGSSRPSVIRIPESRNQFPLVGGSRSQGGRNCFSFKKDDEWTITEGVLEGFSASLKLPQAGSNIKIQLPNAALQAEAWDSETKYLGRLTSDDWRTFDLDLETRQEKDFTLQFIVRAGSVSTLLDSVLLDGTSIQCGDLTGRAGQAPRGQPEAPRRQQGNPRGEFDKLEEQPACVQVDMAVYGQNIDVSDDVDSPVECWEMCQANPRCQFWNHNMYSAQLVAKTGKVGRCHIKKGKGKRIGNIKGYKFGAKSCRPS